MKCRECGTTENLFICKNQYNTSVIDICCECRCRKIRENVRKNGIIRDTSFFLQQLEKNNIILDSMFENLSKKQIYDKIVKDTDFLNKYNKVSLSERYYCIINMLSDRPVCEVCKNTVNFISLKEGYLKTCSKKCKAKSNKKIERYTQTCLNKYGVESTNQLESKKQKTKETCLEKYGSEYYTNREKCSQTWKDKTDEELKSIVNKRKETNLERYGVDNYFKTNESKQKNHFTKRLNNWNLFINLLNKKYLKPLFDYNDYLIIKTKVRKYECLRCGNVIESDSVMVKEIFCPKHNYKSIYEHEIKEFIKSLNINDFEIGKRIKLNNEEQRNFELDLYLPHYKLGIEFHGLYWHCDINKEKKYHYKKYEWCNNNNIKLIQIFENEWINKQDIIKSIIKANLGLNNIIYARKCQIKELDNSDYEIFLNKNHIQGSIKANIKYGLYYNNSLVSVMSFGKSRFNDKMELLRYCNKLNLNIVGGFSKLFKFITSEYKLNNIVTYSDLRYFDGSVYRNVGFIYSHTTEPNYFYFKCNTINLENRMKFQKHKLEKILDLYDNSKSEYENMMNNNYLRIYDAGNKCFIWNDIINNNDSSIIH